MTSAIDTSSTELFAIGVDEVEPWICEDTYENRALLRTNKFMWTQVDGDDGLPTGLLRVFSPEALTARRDTVWETRRPIMAKPDDRFSEYVHPDEYPEDYPLAWWLQQRLRGWHAQAAEGVPESERRPFPVRCETRRNDGTRCWNWAPTPRKSTYCKQHLPWQAEQELKNTQIARLKLLQAAPLAADVLEDLAMNATGEAVRLKASTEILDRVGVRGGVEIDHHVEVEQVDPAAAIREKLQRLANNPAIAAMLAPPAVIEEAVPEAEVVE